MSSSMIAEAPRRRLNDRQAGIVDRLTEAAVAEIAASGYDAFTVRNVARRTGVAPATAYTYFASKDHLIAECFWRKLRALPSRRADRRRSAVIRVGATLRDVAALLSSDTELATASTTAMLASDPDVKHLRDRVGAYMRGRVTDALGPEADGRIVNALELCVAGAMIQAGMGHLSYEDLPDRVVEVAALLLKGRS